MVLLSRTFHIPALNLIWVTYKLSEMSKASTFTAVYTWKVCLRVATTFVVPKSVFSSSLWCCGEARLEWEKKA